MNIENENFQQFIKTLAEMVQECQAAEKEAATEKE